MSRPTDEKCTPICRKRQNPVEEEEEVNSRKIALLNHSFNPEIYRLHTSKALDE
jgi:hypothetical protein